MVILIGIFAVIILGVLIGLDSMTSKNYDNVISERYEKNPLRK